jgi:hypothetical protein
MQSLYSRQRQKSVWLRGKLSVLYVENPGSARFTLIHDLPHVASSTEYAFCVSAWPGSSLCAIKTLTSMDHSAEGLGNYVVDDLADAGENGSQPNN